MKRRVYCLSLLLLLGIFSLVSCSPKSGVKVLSFFFDGVPDSLRHENSIAVDSIASRGTLKDSSQQTTSINPDFKYHPPYLKQECTACHDKSARSRIIQSQPGLCFKCHLGFQQKYSFVHGPVDGGYCTQCHAPHMSQYDKLLKQKDPELCLQCHSILDLMKNQVHKESSNGLCLECHLPHGGDKKYLLR